MTRSLLAALGLCVVLSACWRPRAESDCLVDHTCECKRKSDCQLEKDCVGGKCVLLPDAGVPGDVGYPCESDSQCRVGPCLPPGPGNGSVCTVTCGGDAGVGCPRGWECKASPGSPSLCTPPIRALCLPCAGDQDCNAYGDRCLALDGGSWCSQECSNAPCPTGYSCRALLLDAGVTRQCVPDTGTCSCSAINSGLERACKQQNPIGTCYGVETCQSNSNWTTCDARSAAPEACNGLDDDCDGLIDQADPTLDTTGVVGWPDCRKGTTCTGKWGCAGLPDGGATFSCSAPDPEAEVCNGRDDDCNGQIDDGLIDSSGHYTSPRACGACTTDCFEVLANLRTDGGVVVPGAASCVDRAGTMTCVPNRCAPGYFPSPAAGPEVCERAVSSECRPCTHVGDCQIPGDECVQVGTDPGTYCLQSCDFDSLYAGCTGELGVQGCCPAGSTCEQLNGKRLCRPQGNSCTCNASRVGFTRSCFRTTANATCVGVQQCDATGSFGECDTSATTAELCDGRDNDCDGVIDDPFINTRGTGTYDSDEHCGNCPTNCKARWSADVQHAVGGCVPDAGAPACAIVLCTSENVTGGALCRTDGDCGGGRICHPQYFQCVRPCGGGCLATEECDEGLCRTKCTGDSQCEAPSKCTNGICQLTYQFGDADKEPTNGCECAAPNGVVDEPDRSTTYPVAGLPYVDRDCDGVDGQAASALFVWGQSTLSQGTRQHPFRTLKEALDAFKARPPGSVSAIMVAQGSYLEQVVLVSGAQVYGGYSSDFGRRDVITFPTLIEAPEPDLSQPGARRGAVNAEELTSPTVFAGFTVRGYDVVSRAAPGQAARNSYAVFVKNSGSLRLFNNHVVGGRGGDASPVASGQAGANGPSGVDGLKTRECASPNCTGETQEGGKGGENGSCAGATRGNPGAGSTLTKDPQDYGSSAGGNGQGGSNSTYQHSDPPTQGMFCKYDCIVPGGGLNGEAAQSGSDGTALAGGPGCMAPLGRIMVDEWSTPMGSSGAPGSPGNGGGGGGAGGCARNSNPATCTLGNRVGDLGGTGGGGGAGGCGGGQGLGAAGGGASFAIFVVGSPPVIAGNLVDLGFGGFGGFGGAGGYGGLGGQGGRGGLNTSVAWCAGLGGPGGRGGNGGAGSGGGGGCGGSVFGIAGINIAGARYGSSNAFAPTPMNAAGAGGPGGSSPAGTPFKGTDGAPGVVATVQSF